MTLGRPRSSEDHVGDFQQLFQRAAPPGVAQGQLVGGVVEEHGHAEVLRQHGELAADVAEADDAQPPPAYLVAARRRLVPHAGVHLRVLAGQPPGQRDDLGQDEFHHAAGVGERRVEDRDTPARRRRQVDLVHPDAERTHREQTGRAGQDALAHSRPRPDAKQVNAVDGGDQLVLTERAWPGLHLVAVLGQARLGVRMNALKQQDTDRPGMGGLWHVPSLHSCRGQPPSGQR
jgi:hypothetical protein